MCVCVLQYVVIKLTDWTVFVVLESHTNYPSPLHFPECLLLALSQGNLPKLRHFSLMINCIHVILKKIILHVNIPVFFIYLCIFYEFMIGHYVHVSFLFMHKNYRKKLCPFSSKSNIR